MWYKPASLFRDKDGKYWFLDGRTHSWIMVDPNGRWKFQNIIADVYEQHPEIKFNEKVQKRAIRRFGRVSNITGHEVKGRPTPEDLIESTHDECNAGDITIDINGEPDFNEVMDYLEDTFGGYRFKKSKLGEIAYRAVGSYHKNKSGKKIYIKKSDAINWLTNESEGRHYINRDPVYEEDENGNEICKRKGIIYYVTHTEQSLLTIKQTAIIAGEKENKDCEIRIIVYKKLCEAIDPLDNYESYIKKFKTEFYGILNSISSAFFNGISQKKSNIKLYAAIPSLGEWHNLDELILFDDKVKNKNGWYQKNPRKGCDFYHRDKNQDN